MNPLRRSTLLLTALLLVLTCACDVVIAQATNDTVSVEVQPGAALFALLDEMPPDQALVAAPVVGSTRGGLVLAAVLAVCRSEGRLQVETAVTHANDYEETGGSIYAVADARGWTEVTPDTDLRDLRGRADGLLLFGQDEPPLAYAMILTTPDLGCDEASILKSGGEYGLVPGDRVATSASVPLHIERGFTNQVGTGGYAAPNVVDLAEGLTLVASGAGSDAGVVDGGR